MKLPVHLVWRKPPRSTLSHAWLSADGITLGVSLCPAFRRHRRLDRLETDVAAEQCDECRARAYAFTVGMPYADRAAGRVWREVRGRSIAALRGFLGGTR